MNLPSPATVPLERAGRSDSSSFLFGTTKRQARGLLIFLTLALALVGIVYLQSTALSQIDTDGPNDDPNASSSLKQANNATLTSNSTLNNSSTPNDNASGGDKMTPISSPKVSVTLQPPHERLFPVPSITVNPAKTYTRPDINMFVDLSLVSARCDALHTSVQSCMDYLRDNEDEYLVRRKEDLPPCDSKNIMYIHAYWRGLMGPGLIWILKSFLYTQRLECTRYVIWAEGFVPLDLDHIVTLMEEERKADEALALSHIPTELPPKNAKYPKIKMPTHYESVKELKKMAPYVEVRPFHLREQLMRTSGLSQNDWDHWADTEACAEAKRLANLHDAPPAAKEKYEKLKSEYRWPKDTLIPHPRFKWPVNMIANVSAELKGNAVSDSDTVRFILLYNYGGIYVDTDVLFLRDMRPWYFTPKSWSSSWGIHDHYNTALLKATRPQDPVMTRILERGAARGAKFHPHEILAYLKAVKSRYSLLNFISAESLLTMIPSGVFDATWPWLDGRHEKPILPNVHINSGLFFGESKREVEFAALKPTLGEEYIKTVPIRKLRVMENLFNGEPAFHCHGIGFEIEKDSWVEILLEYYNCFLAGTCHNVYNETFQPSAA